MTSKVRFAPSPTGLLHVGNARIALLNWLLGRKLDGRFLLRLDDTDRERSRTDYARAIEEDLLWLGLQWDEFAAQSSRLDHYAAAAERLKASGRLYPCYETPEELALSRKLALKAGRPPIYDRAALELTPAQRAAYEGEGRKPHWRFALEHALIAWGDVVRGAVAFEGANLSDPVLVRADSLPLYTLSSVVDDLELGVTHVLRGEDHVANTAVQIQLIEALGGQPPVFAHLPLIADAAGQGLSKRLGSLSLAELRAQGIEAMALNSYLAKLGTPDPIEPRTSLDQLVAEFDLSRFGRATPKFDPNQLAQLNARLIHLLPYEAVAERLDPGTDAALWSVLRPNLTRVDEAADWARICRGELAPRIEDPEFTRQAAELLPAPPWDEATWAAWTAALKTASGRKGKALFRPLRLALTGREEGPELKHLLPLIGPDRARARLRGETA